MFSNRKVLYGGGAVLLVVVIAVAGGLWWYFGDDAPDEVDLETAIAANITTTTTVIDAAPTTTTAAAPADAGIEGVWTVDTSIGDFDFSSATGTFAGFRVQEELSGIGSKTAVGRTGDVTGMMEISGATLESVSVEVDLSTLTTDDSRRDSRVRSALNTSEQPLATFVLSEPVDLGEAASAGGPVSAEATGAMTINGVTNEMTFAIDAQLVDGVVFVVGRADVVFADYEVTPPTSPAVLSIDDNGVVELQLLFTAA